MSLTVCHVWDYEYPWDVRVEKVSRALTAAGHSVHLTARNRGRLPVREEIPGLATVHRLKPVPWLGRTLEAASMFPAFFNPRWSGLIRRTVRESGADVILVRDLPLAPTAIRAARKLGLPIVHDMAENYGAMIRDLWLTGTTRFGDSLVRNPRLVEAVERWCLPRLDHILVVVEEARDRLIGLGVPQERITIVGNTPPAGRVRERSFGSDGEGIEAVYLGLMEEARGVALAIEAVASCRARSLPVRLRLIGDGRDLEAFRRQADALDLEGDAVEFMGFVPNERALELVAGADVGLIPHHVNESWNTTVPNKLFDYMAAGLPVVGSDARPVARILKATGAGLVFRDRDVDSLVSALEELVTPESRAMLGEAGRRAVRESYHWEADARRLVQAVEGVMTGEG